MAKKERKNLKQKYLKYRRKILVGLGIVLSPIVLSMISYYCSEYYSYHNININNQNYLVFFLMLGFMMIISLANFVNTLYSKRLTRDTHNILQILFEVVLEDGETIKKHSEEIKSLIKKYGDR